MLTTAMILAANFIADVTYSLLDPRIKLEAPRP